jgi:hypothetical protein
MESRRRALGVAFGKTLREARNKLGVTQEPQNLRTSTAGYLARLLLRVIAPSISD